GVDPIIEDGDEAFIAQAMTLLPEMPFDVQTWSTWTGAVKQATGRKGRGLFRPLRLALTGQEHGPEMGALMPLLQKVKARG
ncbi:MAG: glutamate--tRNA ligase, partial [Paracoccaceae bacterium]